MKQFAELTKYIPMIERDEIGQWHVNKERLQFPFVIFSEMVHHFMDDVYALVEQYPEWGLNCYGEILEENNLEWNLDVMSRADVATLNAKCVCALLVGAIRADRFCEGALLGLFENGSIGRWLQRLKDIDEAYRIFENRLNHVIKISVAP